MELYAAGVLSALAAAVFGGLCGANRSTIVAVLVTFVAGVLAFTLVVEPTPAAIGLAAVTAATVSLARPGRWWLAPVGAGGFAASWVSVLYTQGLPLTASVLIATAAVGAGVWLAGRRGFAPDVLRDEALLIVGGFALVLAVGADLVTGWRSAAVLTREPLAAGGFTGGLGLVALVIGSIVLGGLYSLWKRR